MTARRDLAAVAAALALLALFAAGALRIFSWQADAGDDVPAYSSLRCDPIGLRVLYETVRQMPGLDAARLYQFPHDRLPEGTGTLLFAGLRTANVSGLGSPEPLAKFARRGGVIVLAWSRTAFAPDVSPPRSGPPRHRPVTASPDPLRTWGVEIRRASSRTPARASDGWPWHSSLYFVCAAPEWETWLESEGRPVLIARPWEGGRLVLASDSYLLSNEGLLRHRRTDLLCRMLRGPTVWFCEAHLGLRQVPGWRDSAARLRLGAVGAVALVLLSLALWRAMAPLLPPRPQTAPRAVRDVGDVRDGFLDLVHRHLPPERLPEVCRNEWRRFCAPANPAAAARLAAAGAPPPDRPPLEALRELHARIHRKESMPCPSRSNCCSIASTRSAPR